MCCLLQEPERPPFLVSLIKGVIGTLSWVLGFYVLFSLGANVLQRSNASTPNGGSGGLAGIAQSGAAGTGAYSPKEYKKARRSASLYRWIQSILGPLHALTAHVTCYSAVFSH